MQPRKLAAKLRARAGDITRLLQDSDEEWNEDWLYSLREELEQAAEYLEKRPRVWRQIRQY